MFCQGIPTGSPFFISTYYNADISMPRSGMSKVDILPRIYKMKTELYNGTHRDKSKEWHDGAHDALNKMLDLLNEYSG